MSDFLSGYANSKCIFKLLNGQGGARLTSQVPTDVESLQGFVAEKGHYLSQNWGRPQLIGEAEL